MNRCLIFQWRCIVAYLAFFSRSASLLACIHLVQFQSMRDRAYEGDAHASNDAPQLKTIFSPTLPTGSPTDGVTSTNKIRLDTSSPHVCKIRCTQVGANAMAQLHRVQRFPFHFGSPARKPPVTQPRNGAESARRTPCHQGKMPKRKPA